MTCSHKNSQSVCSHGPHRVLLTPHYVLHTLHCVLDTLHRVVDRVSRVLDTLNSVLDTPWGSHGLGRWAQDVGQMS